MTFTFLLSINLKLAVNGWARDKEHDSMPAEKIPKEMAQKVGAGPRDEVSIR